MRSPATRAGFFIYAGTLEEFHCRIAAARDRQDRVYLSQWLVAKLTRNMVCFPDIRPFLYDKGHAS
jgi:hypothetical protein